ncbi:transcriptional regulator [Acrocarpospora phusangensis]|uniref:Transcriptional regulator n=1 Tax=Acrocarpospora phusangensis TaxID=1070424 RepID=A0A919UME8_9ACTN|nr:MurR/RpiR family transcriptional regulator [Acrocarpospora phusangensis]GIH27241.1 transcriptional regulator [Acrocarpospora phusangensis]
MAVGDGIDELLAGRRLSPVQRRIAHYLGEHLSEAIFLSSVELAERAGVSQPSVTRFAAALGFAGYPELRQALRPLVLGVGGDGKPDIPGERALLRNALDAEIRNLAALRDRGEFLALIAELGVALAASEPLLVVGVRVSSGLATTFAYYARRIHPDVRLLTHGGSELADGLHSARRAGAAWVLAVVLPRYPAEAVEALESAKELGLRVAVITDRSVVPFPADVVLDAPVGERLVFDSHAAPLALAMLLVEAMADAAPLRTQARLEEYERMTEQRGVFVDPPVREDPSVL